MSVCDISCNLSDCVILCSVFYTDACAIYICFNCIVTFISMTTYNLNYILSIRYIHSECVAIRDNIISVYTVCKLSACLIQSVISALEYF